MKFENNGHQDISNATSDSIIKFQLKSTETPLQPVRLVEVSVVHASPGNTISTNGPGQSHVKSDKIEID